ncbi:glyoxalase [Arthrobacter sp. MYb227]|uniref:VOC family protein n=1 Tax=Arthrobacter sp. MYb227 TaxID=1848601 RepID=UPI000CFC8383|nr:VOC family protein [Arthrobacter sp. MYb227]PQZ94968.1 glyoxalase [Arthrobacter sp. MYb227]
MPKPTITAGSPCWIDLMTSDPQRSMGFYSALFGWTFEIGDQEKYGGYTMAFKDGQAVAGLMENDGVSGYPDVWSTYLRVEDIAASVQAAAVNGGTVHLQPMDVPKQGKMAMIGDVGGASIGLWEFGGHTGYQLAAEPGAPAWHELFTRNFPATVKFYEDVFGWDISVVGDSDEFRYSTLGSNEEATAGIMDATSFLPAEVPANWHVYFAVENADATIQETLARGGTVIQPAEDTPFGRNAALTDATGAQFWITQEMNLG